MSALFAILLLALTRAEIIERLKAPVVRQADGMIRVYANCPEDMRREYQQPVARFAAETVKTLYQGLAIKQQHFKDPAIAVLIGDVRTNDTSVVARAKTNAADVVTRIYLRAPGYSDLSRLRLEIVKAFARRLCDSELDDAGALALYRKADPQLRLAEARLSFERWFTGGGGDAEEGLRLMRTILEPGYASRREVLMFASRLFLYPPTAEGRFVNGADCLSFKEALELVKDDPRIRLRAYEKAGNVLVFGGGRGDALKAASEAYHIFLKELCQMEKPHDELAQLLEDADIKLNIAFEQARKREGGK